MAHGRHPGPFNWVNRDIYRITLTR
ncbi:hypothetical protein YPPY10_0224, partial [Yersinia pestis PY-10]